LRLDRRDIADLLGDEPQQPAALLATLLLLPASACRRRVLPVSPDSFAGLSRSPRSGRAAVDQDDPSAEPIAATLRAQQDSQINDRHNRAAVIKHSRQETGSVG